jgi:Fe-S-cluster containining protein
MAIEMDSREARKSWQDLESEILMIYEELDLRIALFQVASGLGCLTGCGACCLNQDVEATVLEVLPLVQAIFSEQQEETVFSLIEARENHGDAMCVLYRPDPAITGKGTCSLYKARPLVCRLFGFASRKNKKGIKGLSTCKLIKAKFPHLVAEAEKRIQDGLDVPDYEESFMRLAVLNPHLGFRRLPINQAIKEALERLYWQAIFPVKHP